MTCPVVLCLSQVSCLVSYGLTFSFPADEANHLVPPSYAAVPDQQLPRPAPLSPAIDTLHVYSALSKAGNKAMAAPSGAGGRAHAVMPLVLRQMMAQMISAANILRLDKVGTQAAMLWCMLTYAGIMLSGGTRSRRDDEHTRFM